MMLGEIPVISITTDDCDTAPDDNGNDNRKYDIHEAHTDIESLDSDDENGSGSGASPSRICMLKIRRKSSPKRKTSVSRKRKSICEAVTDIEDYNDSDGSDASETNDWEEEKIDLNQFLDQGFVEEMSSHARAGRVGGMRQNNKPTFKSYLGAPVEDDGGITDCEGFDTSGDEAENDVPEAVDEKSFEEILQEMLVDDGNNVSIHDAATLSRSPAVASSACVSDASESDDNEMKSKQGGVKYHYKRSMVENLMLSDSEARTFFNKMCHSKSALDAEEIVMQASDYEDCPSPTPDMGITFLSSDQMKTKRRQNRSKIASGNRLAANTNNLYVAKNADEAITDVENLNSSDDEIENGQSHLTIPTAVIKDGDAGLTDVECFDIDEDCIPDEKADIKLPSPVREITLMTADNSGDPITRVMPLNSSGTFLGVVESTYIDKGLTDTEDVSGNEEDYYCSQNYAARTNMPEFEGGVVHNSESVSTLQKAKRELMTHIEPLTDVEELFFGSTSDGVRRRKPKPRAGRSKHFLETQRPDTARCTTDMEDLDVSDDQADQFQRVQRTTAVLTVPRNEDEGITDTEDISGDEDEYVNKAEEIDINVLKQEAYFSTVTTCDGTLKEQFNAAVPERAPKCELSAESEVLQFNSDTDDLLTVEGYSRADTVTPIEVRDELAETCRSHVFEHSEEKRDQSNENIHIKGYRELADVHTDIECFEEEIQYKSNNFNYCSRIYDYESCVDVLETI